VLRAVDGHITERTDFGEYIESFGLGKRFQQTTEDTRQTAMLYLRAYLGGDLDTQEALVASDVIFQDPTSKIYGPPSGEVYRGREALIARRRQIYESITGFDLQIDESFVANHHAVYMGTVTYTVGENAHYAQPAVFVLEVRDGKVVRHWDFVDYTVGPNEQS
jgi:ketosteroid isomerase-like protein